MGRIAKPQPVKLFIGLLARSEDLLPLAERLLANKFGPVDHRSPVIPFSQTDYYRRELGPDIKRQFLGFRRLVKPDDLPKIKVFTNRLEKRLSDRQGRQVNLDPGILDQAKVVLATTKDFTHRLYLSLGIWAEVTLHYAGGRWQSWPWTYPDYQTEAYQQVFAELRRLYRSQLSFVIPA